MQALPATDCDAAMACAGPPLSPSRQTSSWSTQDGFVGHCLELLGGLERGTHAQGALQAGPCASDARGCFPLAERADAADCDATCTSRSTLLAKQGQQDQRLPGWGAPQQHAAKLLQPPGACRDHDTAMPDQDAGHCQAVQQQQPLQQQQQWQPRPPLQPPQQQPRPPPPSQQARPRPPPRGVLRPEQQQEELLTMISNERARERELSPACGFLERADGGAEPITPQMRMIVCSWLSEVAAEFGMQQETLFLAVALMDRFMSETRGVPRSVLQLVAVACVLLASKQDEVVHPSVEELTDIAANCFQVQDLMRMERVLLDGLGWRIKTPTAYTFLHLYTQATAVLRAAAAAAAGGRGHGHGGGHGGGAAVAAEPLQGMVVAKAAYLVELSMVDYCMLSFRPSQVAAAALLLAQSWSDRGASAHEVQRMSGYSPDELRECMGRLLHLHQCSAASGGSEALAPLTFIRDKYSQDCWLQASLSAVPAHAPSPRSIARGGGGAAAAAAGGAQHGVAHARAPAAPPPVFWSGCS